MLLDRKPSALPEYNGCLLELATELADRLLPSFDTGSGIPLSWIHLQRVRNGGFQLSGASIHGLYGFHVCFLAFCFMHYDVSFLHNLLSQSMSNTGLIYVCF